jgi:heat shock protein HslJ
MTRYALVRSGIAAVLLLLTCGVGAPAELFPFDQEFLLDAEPMRPGKRMPILTIKPNGDVRIDLWCRTVSARVEILDAAIKIEPGPLPEGLPEMMSAGQCTPERMQADEELLGALIQVTGWRRQGDGIVLEGPKTLKFRPSDH